MEKKKLRFGRCDFCGKEEWVFVTNYGTSHYNRLMCEKCMEEINEHDRRVFGIEKSIDVELIRPTKKRKVRL